MFKHSSAASLIALIFTLCWSANVLGISTPRQFDNKTSATKAKSGLHNAKNVQVVQLTPTGDVVRKNEALYVKLDSVFDANTVYPQYVVGFGSIFIAITTVIIVVYTSRQTIKATELYADVQVKTSVEQVQAQLEIAEKERVKEVNLRSRQAWIDNLRSVVSTYLQLLYDLRYIQNRLGYKQEVLSALREGTYRNSGVYRSLPKDREEDEARYSEICSSLQLHAAKIELLLSPTPCSAEKQLVELLNLSQNSGEPDSYINPILDITKTICKNEWVIIKKCVS